MQDDVAAILEGWTDLRVQDFGPFWLVVGVDPYGTPRGGSRVDVLSLAADLRDIAEREKPAPVEVSPPAPEAVQPTPQEEASAPPSVDASSDADGGAAQPEEPPPAQVSPPSAPAYAGTMLQEDRENYLRGVITVRVTQIEQNRLQGRYDANARERQRVGFVEFHNASDLGLPITDEVRAAYDEFLAADQWVRATKDHADALRSAAITVGLDLLEAMQTSVEENWP